MTALAYYNEIDPFAAEWLRHLMNAWYIAPGWIDTRSIEDVQPRELEPFTQCHFFAGIGVWSYTLRLAGWPDEIPVWTGSCPCQPFSSAGSQGGFDDERHLWPAWHWLVEQWRPVEPGAFPLVDGTPARVGRLRGYGNAINAEAARAFVEAYLCS